MGDDAEERDWRSGANEIARIRKYVAMTARPQPELTQGVD